MQKDFQNLDDSKNEEQNIEYGISPLHARIRCMEFILKLAYTIPRVGENFEENTPPKDKQNIHKKIIQNEFIKKLGLKVDCTRYINTNDGNDPERFMKSTL